MPQGRRRPSPRRVPAAAGRRSHGRSRPSRAATRTTSRSAGSRRGDAARRRRRRTPRAPRSAAGPTACQRPSRRTIAPESARRAASSSTSSGSPSAAARTWSRTSSAASSAEHGARQGGGVVRGEAPEVHDHHPGAAQRRQSVGRVLVGAHRAEHPDARPPASRPARYSRTAEGVAVGPVQVVEDHDGTAVPGDHPEQLDDGLAEHQDGVDEVRRRPRRRRGRRSRRAGGGRGRPGTGASRSSVARAGSGGGGQRLGQRAERAAAGHRVPAQHPRARRRGPRRDLVEQPGLPAARLAGDERDPAGPRQGRADEDTELVVPSDERRRPGPTCIDPVWPAAT